jgi:hypothetical protein
VGSINIRTEILALWGAGIVVWIIGFVLSRRESRYGRPLSWIGVLLTVVATVWSMSGR